MRASWLAFIYCACSSNVEPSSGHTSTPLQSPIAEDSGNPGVIAQCDQLGPKQPDGRTYLYAIRYYGDNDPLAAVCNYQDGRDSTLVEATLLGPSEWGAPCGYVTTDSYGRETAYLPCVTITFFH